MALSHSLHEREVGPINFDAFRRWNSGKADLFKHCNAADEPDEVEIFEGEVMQVLTVAIFDFGTVARAWTPGMVDWFARVRDMPEMIEFRAFKEANPAAHARHRAEAAEAVRAIKPLVRRKRSPRSPK